MNDNSLDPVYDVIIVGAGISGINAAHHLQEQLPSLRYLVLEARDNTGGTWDLFRYPGIRSDTDLHTFGFGWSPWDEHRAIADGASIARYLSQTAKKEGIDRHIRCQHRVIAAQWSSETCLWDLEVMAKNNRKVEVSAKFLVLGTGYYDYHEPLQPEIPGLSNFKGTVAYPQFWPEDLDYAGKKVVIIGSGATAITLLPNIAKKSSHVTMLQRSPTYIMSINNTTGGSWIHKLLPRAWAFKLDRWAFMWSIVFLYNFCRLFPGRSRATLERAVAKQLPDHIPMNPHFEPTYKPWDQRVCFTPNGDFFESLRDREAHIATGCIKNVDVDSILLESGERLEADIIIPATGLKLAIGGRIQISVDGKTVDLADRYAWRTGLLQDVPNLAFMMGYVNASWTLGVETTAQLVCRLIRHMQREDYTSAVPRVPAGSPIQRRLIWNLDATYVHKAQDQMPRCGDIGPWKGRTNYFVDLFKAKYGSITKDIEFSKARKA
ncbi:hypothetical protein MGN70_009522 [Eutypa lata]|nr:hypothetical protein MGN70_009522 [Eutypa lata]